MTDEMGTDAAGRYILFGDSPIEEEPFARIADETGRETPASALETVTEHTHMLGAAGEEFVYVSAGVEQMVGVTYANDMFNDANFDLTLILLQAEALPHSSIPVGGNLVSFGEMYDDQIDLDHLFDAMELAKSSLPDPVAHMMPDPLVEADTTPAFTGADDGAGMETAHLTPSVDLGLTIDRLFEHIVGGDQS